MKVNQLIPVRDQGDREIGIEIEMEGARLHPKTPLNYWNVTHDGSLRPNPEAVEYVLRQPVPRSRVKARLDYLQAALAKNEADLRPSDRCGVHVHLNCQNMEMSELFRMVTLYLILEETVTSWCGVDRESNLFCLRAQDAEYLMHAAIEAKRTGNLSLITDSGLRYAAINFAALSKYGSVEFRALPTTADFSRINSWVKILLRIRDKALEAESDTQLIERCSTNGPLTFAKSILGTSFDLVKTPEMANQIRNGLEISQNLAYVTLHPSLAEISDSKKLVQKKNLYGDAGPIRPRTGPIPMGDWRPGARVTSSHGNPPPPPNPNDEPRPIWVVMIDGDIIRQHTDMLARLALAPDEVRETRSEPRTITWAALADSIPNTTATPRRR